jgi:hypothetical protein
MQKVAYLSAMMTTPFFALFRWTWFYLSAICRIFTITNYIFSVTLRMIGLWKERGFGWWLLGGQDSISTYHSVNPQLDEARKTLIQQQEAAAHQLTGVHPHYEGLLSQYETEQPSAQDG